MYLKMMLVVAGGVVFRLAFSRRFRTSSARRGLGGEHMWSSASLCLGHTDQQTWSQTTRKLCRGVVAWNLRAMHGGDLANGSCRR